MHVTDISNPNQFWKWLSAPFICGFHGTCLLVSLFILINLAVLFNAKIHNPEIAYDIEGHLGYVKALVEEARLPNPEETDEFFSPPLPYIFPFLVKQLTAVPYSLLAKIGQYTNWFISLFISYFVLRIAYILQPRGFDTRLIALFILGTLPVYYKTLAMGIRGEPYVSALSLALILLLLSTLADRKIVWLKYELIGVFLALIILSRQWGFFLIPTICVACLLGVVFNKEHVYRRQIGHALLLTLSIATIFGGAFYFHLYKEYGTFTTFNRTPYIPLNYEKYVENYPDLMQAYIQRPDQQATLTVTDWGRNHYEYHGQSEGRKIEEATEKKSFFLNQRLEFYLGTGNGHIFSTPIRGSFQNQFFPIFYTEIWGDYWGYFHWAVQSGYYKGQEDERISDIKTAVALATKTVGPYLGRVNFLSLVPSIIFVCGVLFGINQGMRVFNFSSYHNSKILNALLIVTILSTFIGYMWFLIKYPNLRGDTIKATYLFHIYPLIALLAANFLVSIKKRSKLTYRCALVALVIIGAHNFPQYFSGVANNSFHLEQERLPYLDIEGKYH
jgi:hypothetical protein